MTAAIEALRQHPDWSDRRLALEAGCSRATIGRYRADLVRRGELAQPARVVARNGRRHRPGQLGVRTNGINHRITALRELTRWAVTPALLEATPSQRRLLWLAATGLAEAIGERIDVLHGTRVSRRTDR